MKIKSIIAAVVAGVISLVAFGERDTAIYRGKLTSDMNANSNRIVGLATPIENGDAANKEYMDSAVSAATNGLRSVDGAARPLPRYLHALDFADSYTNEAAAYYRTRGDGKTDGGCSAARSGGFLYRNFDFPLDDRAEFVVRMAAGAGRFASVGVAQVGTNLTEKFVTSGKWSPYYKALPGATVDGVNENGVVAEINVVDGEPAWQTGGDIHPLGAVRWALDNGTSAAMVASNLALRIAFPSGWVQNYHYMIADERETWIVENGTAYPILGRPVMTNFRIAVEPPDGPGIERYNILMNPANSITNVWYTRAYSPDTNWVSEFDDPPMADVKAVWERLGTKAARRATGAFWQSVHTSIYDITNRTLRVAVQEQDDWYVFAVPVTSGIKTETDPTVPAWAKQATPPEGMAENALVLTNGVVKTKAGAAVAAENIGAYARVHSTEITDGVYRQISAKQIDDGSWDRYYVYDFYADTQNEDESEMGINVGMTYVTSSEWDMPYSYRAYLKWNHIVFKYFGGQTTETYFFDFPYDSGTIALQTYSALSAMLTDANTNTNADCECISTNLCKLVERPVSNLVVNVRDKFYDETLGVTWQKKIDNGFVTYEVISNEDIAP